MMKYLLMVLLVIGLAGCVTTPTPAHSALYSMGTLVPVYHDGDKWVKDFMHMEILECKATQYASVERLVNGCNAAEDTFGIEVLDITVYEDQSHWTEGAAKDARSVECLIYDREEGPSYIEVYITDSKYICETLVAFFNVMRKENR